MLTKAGLREEVRQLSSTEASKIRSTSYSTGLKWRKCGGCRLWVNRVALTVRRTLPVYPHKQTSETVVSMSQRCQKRKSDGFQKCSRGQALASAALDRTGL